MRKIFWLALGGVVVVTIVLVVSARLFASWQTPLTVGAAFFPSAILAVLTWRYVQINQEMLAEEHSTSLERMLVQRPGLRKVPGYDLDIQGMQLQLWNCGRHAIRVSATLSFPCGIAHPKVIADRLILAAEASQEIDATAEIVGLLLHPDGSGEERMDKLVLQVSVEGVGAPLKLSDFPYTVRITTEKPSGSVPYLLIHAWPSPS